MASESIKLPLKVGTIELAETSGRCDCGVRGGGLLEVTVLEPILEGVEREVTATLCGNCLVNRMFG